MSSGNRLSAVICVLFLGAGILAVNDLCLYTPDSTRYLSWSSSLADFDGFRDRTSPEMERYVVHAPLYALLLAPVAFVSPFNIISAKIFTLCIGAVVLFLFHRLLARQLSAHAALIGMILLAVNSLFFIFSTEILSDVPFLAMVLLAFLTAAWKEDARVPTGRAIAFIVILAVSVLLREIGVALVVAGVVALLIKREYKWTVVALLFSAAVYLLWWYRNEIIVASVEMPALTNTRLFTARFFTDPGASLLSELLARFSVNAERYGSMVAGLIFFPVYATGQFDVVSRSAPAIASVFEALSWGKYFLGALAGSLTLPGIILDLRLQRMALVRIIFLVFYAGIVLAYPINDVRFLLPMLVLALFYSSVTIGELDRRIRGNGIRVILLLAGLTALMPMLVWNVTYIANSLTYQRSPGEFSELAGSAGQHPSHFTKPLPVAGEWLQKNSPEETVIISQWKDLAASLGGRKLLNVDQTLPSEEFDALIRDYRVTYLVAVRQKNGLREFEFQMSQSRRFSFTLIHSIAALEIFNIGPKRNVPDNPTSPFGRAFVNIGNGSFAKAVSILDSLRMRDPSNLGAMFYAGIARECAGDLAGAAGLFEKVSSFPQAGMFLEQARLHRKVVGDLKQAEETTDSAVRTDLLVNAGMRLWNLGLRKRGAGLIYSAASAMPGNLPATTLATLFAIEEGNATEARRGIERIAGAESKYPLAGAVLSLARQMDSSRTDATPEARSKRFASIGNHYMEIGLIERGIDLYLAAIAHHPSNIQPYEALISLYERKRRARPALVVVRALLLVDPANAFALRKSAVLVSRFE